MGIDSTTTVVLGSERFKSSQNTNLSLDVTLNGNQKEIIEFDRNVDLSLQIVFDEERQESTIFRPTTKIVFLFNNSYSGSTSYVPFRDNLYYTNAVANAITSSGNPNAPWDGFPQYTEFD